MMFRKLGMSKGVKGHEGTPEYLDKYRRWRVDFFKKMRRKDRFSKPS